MIRSLGVAFALFLVITATGVAVIWSTTHESDVLAQSVLNQAQSALASTGESIVDLAAPETLDGEVLDGFDSSTDALSSVSQHIETHRLRARDDLIQWFSLTMIGGLIASMVWIAFAFRRARDVHGPQGARSAAPLWWGCFLALGVAGCAVAFYILRAQGLSSIITGTMINAGFALTFALAYLYYYLSTALGAPPVIRPSVPLATLIIR